FFNVTFNATGSNATIVVMSHAILIYTLIYAASRYLFFPSGAVPNLLKLPVWFGRILHVRLMLLVSWLLFSYFVTLLLLDQSLHNPLVGFMRIYYITIFNLLMLYFCLL